MATAKEALKSDFILSAEVCHHRIIGLRDALNRILARSIESFSGP
jgi:hypothetical protein